MRSAWSGTDLRSGRPSPPLDVDPTIAAALEVEWWHQHRASQQNPAVGKDALTKSLVALYAYVYRADTAGIRSAAEHRVRAMTISDAWVAAGCRMDDPLLAEERLALVASFTALRDASDRGAFGPS